MIGLVSLTAAAALTAQGLPRINAQANAGPPDRYLQDDIYDITGQHLCDRRLADRLRHRFDRHYGQRLAALHRGLIALFGVDAMGRDIVRITSCRTFSGESGAARRARLREYRQGRVAFADALSAWERYVAMRQRG